MRGRREIRRAHRACGGSRIQVFGLYDARRRARDVGKGRTVRYQAQGRSLNRDLGRCLKGAAPGARGDGYRVGAYRTYSEPIRRSFINQRGDEVSPIDNDNYFFNVSTTMGERDLLAAARGRGGVRPRRQRPRRP